MNKDFMPKDKRLLPTEGEEQARLFSWCRRMAWQWPELGLLFHIPNGGSRNKAEAGRFKAEGVKAGVPDLMLPVARGEYHGLFIELKRLDGGRVRPEQKAWMDKLPKRKVGLIGRNGRPRRRTETSSTASGPPSPGAGKAAATGASGWRSSRR